MTGRRTDLQKRIIQMHIENPNLTQEQIGLCVGCSSSYPGKVLDRYYAEIRGDPVILPSRINRMGLKSPRGHVNTHEGRRLNRRKGADVAQRDGHRRAA